MAKVEEKRLTVKDVDYQNEWNTTRRLFSQLYILSTMQNLLLRRMEAQFDRHGIILKQQTKYLFNQAHNCIKKAAELLDKSEFDGSGMGAKGDEEFFKLNTNLNREAYYHLRCMLATQNAVHHMKEEEEESIIDYLNSLSTGKKRLFSKKLIDTFRLEEDK